MALAPFDSVDLTALRWMRDDSGGNSFSLKSGDTTIATLVWNKPRGSLATAVTTEGRWTLKRTGFVRTHLTARPEGSTTDVARLVSALADHRIEIANGPIYDMKHTSRLVPAWSIRPDGTDTEIVSIESVREGRKLDGAIYEVEVDPKTLPDLPMLLLLSWYFIVLEWFEDEVAGEWADHAEGGLRLGAP